MNIDMISVALKVLINCAVFAAFLFVPFKSRFRCSYRRTMLLASLLTAITVVVTILFLTPGGLLVHYNGLGVVLWIVLAVLTFRIAIRGSSFEVLFIVLVVLNLYVNIAAIARVILSMMHLNMSMEVTRSLIVTGVLIAYIPFIWILIIKLYKQVIEFDMHFSFWRFIWIIPTLTYIIFFVKIINDYWKKPVQVGAEDVIFIILWSFTTYAFFCVTLWMIIQTYKGIIALEQTHIIAAQLSMQKEQYERLLDNIENTARLRHDWRHHLLSISGFVEAENLADLQAYLREVGPEYLEEGETAVCSNYVVDVILRHYTSLAKAQGVSLNLEVDIPKEFSVPDKELCIIFGNLVENAMEACMGQKEDEPRSIEVKAHRKGEQIVLMMKNTYGKKVIFKAGVFYSTKHEGIGIGIGLSSVDKIVEKNKGIMKVNYDEHFFTVNILI